MTSQSQPNGLKVLWNKLFPAAEIEFPQGFQKMQPIFMRIGAIPRLERLDKPTDGLTNGLTDG